jgi:speckle-type POZ protein
MPAFTGVSFVGDAPASAAIHVAVSGCHLLVANGYSRIKDTPNGKCLRSQGFKIGGHRWFIEYCPNGYEPENASDYMTFYLVLDEGSTVEPVHAHYVFSSFGQAERQEPSSSLLIGARGAHKFFCNDAISYGCCMRRQDLEKSIHLKNDGFTIRCDIAIVTDFNLGDAGAAMRFVVVPPADIQNHLYNLLLSQEGADVTFQVGDEKFAAHRCVLAARSAVFKAELFGPMKEGTTDTVAIDDSPFRLLLVFIYCDSIPEFEEEEEEFMLQHLLVAADKYDVPRLRLMCGQKLCRCINTDTVPTILELAEQHHCQGLKDACLDFLSSLANLQEVTAAGGLDNLTSSSPSD